MANQTSDYQLKIGVVTDQTSFKILQQSLQNIINLAKQPGNELNKELQEAAKNAQLMSKALEDSYNTKTSVLNIARMNKELEKSNLSVNTLRNSFQKAGPDGANAFNAWAAASMHAGIQIKKTNKLLDSLALTMTNTVKWGITSGIWNSITSQLSGAVTYVEKLDHSLNDIRVVTNKNASAMAEFAKQANKAAQTLGASTTDYTDAALIYYQQGLAEAEVKARTEVTMKTANVTRQSTDEVSEQLTAVWNGYKVSAQEAELYIDKLAAVAASTAADLEELSTGMSKVASAASEMGVDVDQLNAQLATIVSVTRQAPESVGTALKTIYARMGDLAIGGEDEFGVSLGTVSGQLAEVGIAVLDQSGNLRDMGDVMEEVAAKWDTWNESQRTAIAIAMAGKRQYNNLIALFSNWDMYSDAIKTSENAMGTLSRQQDIYMESTDAKLQKVTTSWEKLYSTLIKTSELNWGIDTINQLVQSFDNLASSFGGGIKTIGAAVAILASLSSSKIGEGLTRRAWNQEVDKRNYNTINLQKEFEDQGLITGLFTEGKEGQATAITESLQGNQRWLDEYEQYKNVLTSEQYEKIKNVARIKTENDLQLDLAKWDRDQLDDERGFNVDEIAEKQKLIEKLKEESDALEETKKTRNKEIGFRGRTKEERNEFDKYNKEIAKNKEKRLLLETEIENLQKQNELLEKKIDIKQQEIDTQEEENKKIKQDLEKNLEKEVGDQVFLKNASATQMQLDALAGSAQLVAGSIMSVHSAFEIWSNDDLSFTEKFTQSIMSLAPALALARSGFIKLRDSGMFAKSMTEVFSKETIKNTLAIIFNTGAKNKNVKATKDQGDTIAKNTLTQKLNTWSQGGGIKGAIGKAGTAISGKLAGVGAALGTVGAIAGVATVAIAGVALYNAHVKKQLENDLKGMQVSAEETAKNTQKALDKATNMQTVSQNLNELEKQYENQEISLQDVQNKAHDLFMEYGEGKLAIDALAMSYEELKLAAEGALSEKTQTAIDSITDSLKAQNAVLEQSAKLFNFNQGFLHRWFGADAEEEGQFVLQRGIIQEKDKNFVKELEKIQGINLANDGKLVSFDYNNLDFEELQRVMSLFQGDLAGDKYYKEWKELIAAIEPQVTQYTKDLEEQNQLNLSQLTIGITKDDVSTLEQYRNVYDSLLAQSSQYFDSTDDAVNFVREYLGTLSEESKQFMISDAIMRDLGVTSDYIKNWSEDEKNYIYLNLDTIDTLEQAKEVLTEMRGFLQIDTANSNMNLANSLYSIEGQLDKEQIEQLYATNFGQQTGISQEIFALMSETQQKQALLSYSFEQLQYVISNQAAIEQQLKDEITQYKAENGEAKNNYTDLEESIESNIVNKVDTLGASSAVVKDNLSSISKILEIIESGDASQYSEELLIIANALGVNLANVRTIITENKKYDKGLNSLTSSLATVQGMTDDYADSVERAKEAVKKHKDGLSSMDSVYGTLSNVLKDYNDKGSLSIDNLTSLMALEPEYLSLLTVQNGQLILNKEGYAKLAAAKLYEAKVAIIEAGIQKIAELQTQKTSDKVEIATEKLNAQKLALEGSSQAWVEFINSQNPDGLNEAAQQEMNSIAALLDLIDSMSGTSIDSIFGENLDKEIKKVYEEFDRYWTENKALDNINRTIDKLEELREHLSGDELKQNLKLTNQYLNDQLSIRDKVAEKQNTEQAELQTSLKKYGVDFDDYGRITNYDEVVNGNVNAWNKSTQGENAKKAYDQFKTDLERYETLSEEMEETQDEYAETSAKIIDNNFEIWTSDMEEMLEKFTDERAFNEYTAEMSKDFKQVYEDLDSVQATLEKNFDSLAYDTIPAIIAEMEKAEQEIDIIAKDGESSMFHSMSQAQEYLKEKQKALREAALETKEVYEELYNSYLDKIDQAIEKTEEFYEQYERINQALEYNAEITELVYGEKAYDLYDALYNSQLKASTSQLSSLMQEKKMYEELYKNAEEGTQEQLKYKERLYELEDQINEKTIKHIELLKDDYANAINKILNTLEKQLTGGSSLSEMEEEWDRTKAKADKYYDTVEGLYQIQTLSNKITQDINKASLSGQKELQRVHDREIAYLREKKNLTEYDVQAAEARHQITLKEIALQEAQMNKNTMKLVRDNNGNWTYQYVANQDDIKAKEQDLLDAYNNLYELADKAYTSNIDALIALNKEYLDSAKEIANDAALTDEERVVKLEQLRDRYLEDYKLLVEENKLYTNDLSVAYNTELAEIIRLGQENLGILPDIEQKFVIDVQDMASVKQEISESLDDIKKTIGTKVSEFDKLSALVADPFISNEEKATLAYDALDEKLKDIEINLTADITGLTIDLTNQQTQVGGLSEKWTAVETECGDAIKKYEEFAGLVDPTPKTLKIKAEYDQPYPPAPEVDDLETTIQVEYGDLPEAPKLDPIYQTVIVTYEEVPVSTKPQYAQIGDRELEAIAWYEREYHSIGDPYKQSQEAMDRIMGIYESWRTGINYKTPEITSSNNDDNDVSRSGGGRPGKGSRPDNAGGNRYQALEWNNSNGTITVKVQDLLYDTWNWISLDEWKKIYDTQMNTGGYTGDWGDSSGRLAVLHRKELVLNQTDTANILSAVSAIRSIAGLNNSINEAMMQGISRMMLEMTGMKANANYNTQSTQSVGDTVYEIHAEFPDANDVNSIREAILSLPNLASQKVLKY